MVQGAPRCPGPFGPNCWTLGRSGPIVGPWAVRAQLLVPGPFGPNCWTLGRSGPIVGPWAVRAHWLGISILQGQWACPMPRLGMSHARLGMSHARLGMSHAQVGHVPCPGWACPMSRGPFWVPFGDPFFVWGPFGSHLGTHFLLGAHFGYHLGTHLPWDPFWGPWDQVGGSPCRSLSHKFAND